MTALRVEVLDEPKALVPNRRRRAAPNGPAVRTASAERLHTTAAGGAGTTISLGQIEDLDPNAEVRNEAWYGDVHRMGLASQMMRDGHVRMSVDAIVGPLLAASWGFKSPTKDPVDVEAARFCEWALFESSPWERLVRIGATGYIRDGASLFELTEKVVDVPAARFPLHPGAGRGSIYAGFHQRALSTVHDWEQDPSDPTRLAGVVQEIPGSDAEPMGYPRIDVQRDLLLRLTWDQEGANFAGFAPLRSAYGAWKMKKILMLLDMIRHEREGTGIPTMEYPRDATDDEKALVDEILQKVRAHHQAYIKLPEGFAFKFSTTTGQSTGIAEAIERCNRDIAYNLGVAWMLLGVAGKTGSWALSDTQRGQYILLLERHARFWEATFNLGSDGWSPVERLVRLNYGPSVSIPRLEARNMPTKDWSTILTMVPQLKSAGALRIDQPLREQIRNILDFGPEDLDSIEEAPAAAPSTSPAEQMSERALATAEAAAARVDEFMGRVEAQLRALTEQGAYR